MYRLNKNAPDLPASEVFFKIKVLFFGYFDLLNIYTFDNRKNLFWAT